MFKWTKKTFFKYDMDKNNQRNKGYKRQANLEVKEETDDSDMSSLKSEPCTSKQNGHSVNDIYQEGTSSSSPRKIINKSEKIRRLLTFKYRGNKNSPATNSRVSPSVSVNEVQLEPDSKIKKYETSVQRELGDKGISVPVKQKEQSYSSFVEDLAKRVLDVPVLNNFTTGTGINNDTSSSSLLGGFNFASMLQHSIFNDSTVQDTIKKQASDLLFPAILQQSMLSNAINDLPKQEPSMVIDEVDDPPKQQQPKPRKARRESQSITPALAKYRRVDQRFVNSEGHFNCNRCSFTSQYTTRFEVHMKQHHPDVAIFKCELCDYETRSKSYLTVHLMNHLGLKPFKCHICDYASPRKDYLNLHLKSHSKVHTFSCDKCSYTTYRNDYLFRHNSEKHKPKLIEDDYDDDE